MASRKYTRKVRGNVPYKGVEVATFLDKWALYILPDHGNDGWASFKLIWIGKAGIKKANYWFGWNGKRISLNQHSKRLAFEYPELYNELFTALQRYRCGRIADLAA